MVEGKLSSFSSPRQIACACQQPQLLTSLQYILVHEETTKCRCINIFPYVYRSSQVNRHARVLVLYALFSHPDLLIQVVLVQKDLFPSCLVWLVP